MPPPSFPHAIIGYALWKSRRKSKVRRTQKGKHPRVPQDTRGCFFCFFRFKSAPRRSWQQGQRPSGQPTRAPSPVPYFSSLCILLCQDLSNTFFSLASRQHQLMSAAAAAELDVHAHSQDLPSNRAARMRLFQFYRIVQMQVHVVLLSNQPFRCI